MVPSGGSPWNRWARDRAETIALSGRWREIRTFAPVSAVRSAGPDSVVSFASNDYLGLSHHPAVLDGATAAIEEWGAGTGSSRLIVGSRPLHSELEDALARWKGAPRSVLFPTGFAANIGALTTFGDGGATIYSDELNHASIVDGCRLARGSVNVYAHLDLEHLDKMLATDRPARALIVSDLVFSMDGDAVNVPALLEIAERHSALVILDEAHAVLPFQGEEALAAATAAGDAVRIGTLSKTLGSMGGFIACAGPLADLLVNCARSFIFTTALSPGDAGAALAALSLLCSEVGEALVRRLSELVDLLAPERDSPIVPVVVGAEERAMEIAARLLKRGLLVPAIRPPTVPEGTSRLRISLCAEHRDREVLALRAVLEECGLTP